jgi:hypothetical protein
MLSGETSQTTVSKTCIKSAGFLREPVRDQIELRAVSPIRLQERCRSIGGNRSIERQDWHMTLPDRRCHSATVQGFLHLHTFTLLTVPPYAQLMGAAVVQGPQSFCFS